MVTTGSQSLVGCNDYIFIKIATELWPIAFGLTVGTRPVIY